MSAFPSSNQVRIRATGGRPRGSSDYFVVVDRQLGNRLGLGSWAVLVFCHPGLQEPEKYKLREKYVAVHCRVRTEGHATANGLGAVPSVAVDQTLRNALGVPFRVFPELTGGTFFLLPAERHSRGQARRDLAAAFGIRYLAVRCQSAHVTDIEKSYVRTPAEVLTALGSPEAGNLVLERPLAMTDADGLIRKFVICEFRMSALAAGERFLEQREKLKRCYPERYPDAQRVLYDYATFEKAGLLPVGVGDSQSSDCVTEETSAPPGSDQGGNLTSSIPEPDIPPIFMDLDARSAWGAKTSEMIVGGFSQSDLDRIGRSPSSFVTPIMVRRSILSAVGRDALQTGIAFLIVLIQFTLAIDMDPNKVSAREIVIALAVAILVSVTLLVARLRQQV